MASKITRAELEQLRHAWMDTQVQWMKEQMKTGDFGGPPPAYAQEAWRLYTAAQRSYRR